MHFQPHGSKNLGDLAALMDENVYFSEFPTQGDHAALGKIILHDQEPFSFINAFHTYRQILEDLKIKPERQKTLDRFTPEMLITGAFRSGIQPIFCHSELNSDDVKNLVDDCLTIDCYYWYHGMIARDWFRHWQYHPEILPKDRSTVPYRFMLYARSLDGTRQYRKKFLDIMEPYQSQIFCGEKQKTLIPSDYSSRIDVLDANIAAIHIVLETLFETSKIHLTEKIFKPMVMSQPFFLLSGPGSLEYLRRYGFYTFGEFWDESYDSISDHNERMMCVKKEIEKIMSLPTKKFQDLYRAMMPIIAHNREHFFSQKFQNYCIQEMENNFKSALDLQQKTRLTYPGGSVAPLMAKLTEEKIFFGPRWPENTENFLKSKHLQVPKEKIIELYPILSQYLN